MSNPVFVAIQKAMAIVDQDAQSFQTALKQFKKEKKKNPQQYQEKFVLWLEAKKLIREEEGYDISARFFCIKELHKLLQKKFLSEGPKRYIQIRDFLTQQGKNMFDSIYDVLNMLPQWKIADAAESRKIRYIGRYHKVREIGEGGNGTCYIIWDPELNNYSVVKVVKASEKFTQDTIVRFFREIKIMGKLKSPHICRALNAITDQVTGEFGLILEYIEGDDLEVIILDNEIRDIKQCLSLMKQIALGTQYLHDRNIIHRDIKPANIRVSRSKKYQMDAFLLDMGLAKNLQEFYVQEDSPVSVEEEHVSSMSVAELDAVFTDDTKSDAPGETLSGTILGSPGFMAPEQAMGDVENINEKSDIFALGLILFQMLSGHPAFVAKTVRAALVLVTAKSSYRSEYHLRTLTVAAPLQAIVYKAMSFDPEDRYNSANEMIEDIVRFERGEEVLAYQYSPIERATMYASKKAVPILTGMFVVLLILFMSFWKKSSDAQYQKRIANEKTEKLEKEKLLSNARAKSLAQEKTISETRAKNLAKAREVVQLQTKQLFLALLHKRANQVLDSAKELLSRNQSFKTVAMLCRRSLSFFDKPQLIEILKHEKDNPIFKKMITLGETVIPALTRKELANEELLDARYQLGRALNGMQRYDEAICEFDDCIAKHQDRYNRPHFGALLDKSQVLMNTYRFKEAEKALELFEKVKPSTDVEKTFTILGRSNYLLSKAMGMAKPNNQMRRKERIRNLTERKRLFLELIEVLKTPDTLKKSFYEYHLSLGTAKSELYTANMQLTNTLQVKLLFEAVDHLIAAKNKSTESWVVNNNIGTTTIYIADYYHRVGKPKKAEKYFIKSTHYFDEAIRIKPSYATAILNRVLPINRAAQLNGQYILYSEAIRNCEMAWKHIDRKNKRQLEFCKSQAIATLNIMKREGKKKLKELKQLNKLNKKQAALKQMIERDLRTIPRAMESWKNAYKK